MAHPCISFRHHCACACMLAGLSALKPSGGAGSHHVSSGPGIRPTKAENGRRRSLRSFAPPISDGLDQSDYVIPKLEADAGTEALGDFELKLTNAVLTYAAMLRSAGYWSRVARDIFYDLPAPEAADVFGRFATAPDARAALDSYNPQHPAYRSCWRA